MMRLSIIFLAVFFAAACNTSAVAQQPNVLFIIADDASCHFGAAYGCDWVKTPNIDQLAREGLIFERAYTPTSKCAPSRSAILTGRNPWQLEDAANHQPYFPVKFMAFSEALAEAGVRCGGAGKTWGPGEAKTVDGKPRDFALSKAPPARRGAAPGAAFAEFLTAGPADRPFFYWFGSHHPHRAYARDAGLAAGKKPSDIDRVPAYWPDTDTVRRDMLDYAVEVEAFDAQVGALLEALDASGQAANTLVIVTSDHGMPFPRVKGHTYDDAHRVPLVARWPKGITNPGRPVAECISFIDFAPTFLELLQVDGERAGMSPITGRSFADILKNEPHIERSFVVLGRERNDVRCRPGSPAGLGYPARAIREGDFFYVHNFAPDRWPCGNPEIGFRDTDASPTKELLQQNDPSSIYWRQAFGKRPREQLFDISKDPDCITNLAEDPAFAEQTAGLHEKLMAELKRQHDPRVLGQGDVFDNYPSPRAKSNSPALPERGPRGSDAQRQEATSQERTTRTTPNVIYIMADELGYFEPSFMGNPNIRTPNLDEMAAEGIVFRNMMAGSSVCAPTRCCLLTGKHSGHTSVRTNGGGTPLRAEEETIASMLRRRGYATGGFGKWGCGGRDSTGVPEKHGFDVFFGYYDQVHAHTYYPPYLIRNSEEAPLEGNQGGSNGKTYSQYVIHDAAMHFIREHSREPFFAYLPYTPPHGIFDIPDSDPAWALYRDKPWPEPARRYAAMVALVDRQVGELLALLKELGIDQNTLVFFSGDNGGADYFKSKEHPRGIHMANKNPQTGVEYRGKKGTLYEGGLRIPFLARWPGKIAPGRVSEHLGYFPDVLPTIAEATGADAPPDLDGLSILPELIGEAAAGRTQAQHEYLYWEIGGWVAIRQGQWRAVRPKANQPWALYDLSADPSESVDLADAQPDIVERLSELAAQAHEPAREGSFTTTERHRRDRRAKFGRQDEPDPPREKAKVQGKKKAVP